jgi:hypothetical protein
MRRNDKSVRLLRINGDTMGERMGRIGRIDTDFFWGHVLEIREKSKKKNPCQSARSAQSVLP